MIERIELHGVGPADDMYADFAERLNVITGDNGLGKSFLLDVAWWALTQSWAQEPALPHRLTRKPPRIEYSIQGPEGPVASEFRFAPDRRTWVADARPLPPDALVVYARVDGGFAVFDPARNATPLEMGAEPDDRGRWRPGAFVFSQSEVWWGLSERDVRLCNGLIADWRLWQLERKREFRALREALAALSPDTHERLEPGRARRIDPLDSREIPTLKMPYGEVPVTHASAAMRRILSLAYLMVWTLHEHREAAPLFDRPPTRHITLLIDEVESHLHPRWQRVILPALLDAVEGLSDGALKPQILCVTHAPLVLTSLESHWNTRLDRLLTLDLESRNGGAPEAALRTVDWRKRGDVNSWLTSEVFDLGQPRSRDAEDVIRRAREVMQRPGQSPEALGELLEELAQHVPETDPLLARLEALTAHGDD